MRAREFILTTPIGGAEVDVWKLTTIGNNETPQRNGRLAIQAQADFPAEIEIEPGPAAGRKPGIVGQVMQWGPRTPNGENRCRLTAGIYCDSAGGLSAVIDSSTNDPSGSPGQASSMPLVFNAGEGAGMYVALYPSDNTIDIQDRQSGLSTGRIRLSKLIQEITESGRWR